MKVLQLTVHFHPNVGGVETHLNDLVSVLIKRDWEVFVLTYQPLVVKTSWKLFETNKGYAVLRLPWFSGWFYKLVRFPPLEFVYLVPGLFIVAPFVIFLQNPDVIHAHGLVAGFVASFWGKVFGKKVIVSTHNIYHFPREGFYRNFAAWIFQNADICMGLSKKAVLEIKSLVPKKDVRKFTYWVDLNNFKRIDNAKNILRWEEKFVVLFVGRLIKEKGILELLESFKNWDKRIDLVILGNGPLEKVVRDTARDFKNLEFVGNVRQDQLPTYYSASDIIIVPSIHEEGFGRVILESLACETPVIAANRGAIPEAMDETVGKLIDITPKNIKSAVEYFLTNPQKLKDLSKKARRFAERRFSERNVQTIIKAYTS